MGKIYSLIDFPMSLTEVLLVILNYSLIVMLSDIEKSIFHHNEGKTFEHMCIENQYLIRFHML